MMYCMVRNLRDLKLRVNPIQFFIFNYKIVKIFIYIYMRWVQVTPSVTLKSYTFSKPLDLSRSNGKKKIHSLMLISDKDLIYYPYL